MATIMKPIILDETAQKIDATLEEIKEILDTGTRRDNVVYTDDEYSEFEPAEPRDADTLGGRITATDVDNISNTVSQIGALGTFTINKDNWSKALKNGMLHLVFHKPERTQNLVARVDVVLPDGKIIYFQKDETTYNYFYITVPIIQGCDYKIGYISDTLVIVSQVFISL